MKTQSGSGSKPYKRTWFHNQLITIDHLNFNQSLLGCTVEGTVSRVFASFFFVKNLTLTAVRPKLYSKLFYFRPVPVPVPTGTKLPPLQIVKIITTGY